MIVLDRYILQPHVCYYCRTGSKVPCVDLMRDDEDNPNRVEHIYLCHECLLHAARIVAPNVGHRVVSTAVFEGMEAAVHTANADAEAARTERDAALAARDMMLESLASNPRPEPETAPDTAGRRRLGSR